MPASEALMEQCKWKLWLRTSFTVAWPKSAWLHGWLSRGRGAGRSDKLQDVISGMEVGQLKGRRLHLGFSLEVITMSDPSTLGEGDPEVLCWPLTASSACPGYNLPWAIGFLPITDLPFAIINNNITRSSNCCSSSIIIIIRDIRKRKKWAV